MACPVCRDMGEIVVPGTSVNPFSGVRVHDPQGDDIVPCPRCTRPETFAGRCRVERLVCRIEIELREAA